MPNNIIDSIQLSGTVYTLSAQTGGGGVPESAFTAYTAATDERISQDEEVTAAALNVLNESLSGKQDTLSAGTNITISGNVISAEGGGKAIEAGRGISVTTGATADTVSLGVPISAGTGTDSIVEGHSGNTASGKYSHAEGYFTTVNGDYSHAEGQSTVVTGSSAHAEGTSSKAYGKSSHAEGQSTTASSWYSHAEGLKTIASNYSEHASGQYNVSYHNSDTFGDSGNTLFSVGNGTANYDKHNAFEIRQNGDIYLTSGGTDIKLQDHLGGGGTVDQTIISGSTNAVAGGAVYNKIDEVEEVTAAGLNALNDAISGKVDTSTYNTYTAATDTALNGKQATLVSGTNIKTINNQSLLGSGNIDIQGGGGGTVESAITSGSTNAVESKAIWPATTYNKGVLLTFGGYRRSTNYPVGCGKLVVENIRSHSSGDIRFINDEGRILGNINITNFGNISVDTSHFEGATATVDGNNVTIIYPSTDISFVQVANTDWTYTAVVEGAWVSENTYMKEEVDGIASGLQNNINSKLDATAYTPTVVDSALNVASTNPVQNQVLYPELRIDNGETETTLAFENRESTNYPNGCTKLIVEVVGSFNSSNIEFYNDNQRLGNIDVNNWGSISVNVRFDGASYEISGTTVIITYPTVTGVTKISVNNDGNYVFKAIVALATSLKDQVLANTTALGGLKLVKLTQAAYDALTVKDPNTLYIIVD